MRNILLMALLLAAGLDARADAPEWETADRIRQVATQYAQKQAGAGTQVEAVAIDARVRMPACEKPLEAFSPPGGSARGAMSIGVRCEAPVAWSLFVPVRITESRSMVILARGMTRGERITANDIRVESRDITTLPYGFLASTQEAVGKVIKRPLTAGAVLTPDAIESQRVIRRGQSVTLVSRVGAAEVRAPGKALDDAAEGDRVKVENTGSRRVVEGVARSGDTVEVSL